MNVHPHSVNRTRGLTHHLTPRAARPHHPLVLACPFTDASVTVSVWLADELGLAFPAGIVGSAGLGAVGVGMADVCPVGLLGTSAAGSPGALSGMSLSSSVAARRR